MHILAHYRRGFLLRRGLVAGVLAALWALVAWTFLNPSGGNWGQGISAVGLLVIMTGWLWWNLLIAWGGLVQRRPLLWVQGGRLVLAHRWMLSIPVDKVRRIEVVVAGPQSRLVVESSTRRIKLSQGWAREDMEAVAAAIRSAIRSDEWVASAPVAQPAAPTAVG